MMVLSTQGQKITLACARCLGFVFSKSEEDVASVWGNQAIAHAVPLQLSNMEADFLSSLHQVRRMAADMDRLLGGLTPPGRSAPSSASKDSSSSSGQLLGAATVAQYEPVSRQVAVLVNTTSDLVASLEGAQEVRLHCCGPLLSCRSWPGYTHGLKQGSPHHMHACVGIL